MADVVVNETTSELLQENITESAINGTTTKAIATPEGMAMAYGSLFLMALVPIVMGSFRSVKHHNEQRVISKKSGEKPDTMTSKDAAMFPIIASGALFSLYIFFKIFSKDYINLLLTGYFFILGVFALSHILSPFMMRLIPRNLPNSRYQLIFLKMKEDSTEAEQNSTQDENEDLVNYSFDHKDIVCVGFCTIVGIWYLWKKHWVANNLLGLAFAINGIELLQLNSIITGCILLGGLFVYDIIWVFGTDVMVTVAKSFEAPIKVVFPQDLLEKGFEANNFAMLGLGDIVIPGIFIALLLRYDNSLKRGSYTYFITSFVAYIVGLLTTIGVMHIYKHAQPALLYLVPACIGFPLTVALVLGDLKSLFQYNDHPTEATSEELDAKEDDKAPVQMEMKKEK